MAKHSVSQSGTGAAFNMPSRSLESMYAGYIGSYTCETDARGQPFSTNTLDLGHKSFWTFLLTSQEKPQNKGFPHCCLPDAESYNFLLAWQSLSAAEISWAHRLLFYARARRGKMGERGSCLCAPVYAVKSNFRSFTTLLNYYN